MLEFVFFDDGARLRFVDFLAARGLPCEQRPDTMAGCVVAVPEDLPDALFADIGERYDALMAEQSALAEHDETLVAKRVVGIQVTLADGTARTVRLDGATGNLLLARFTPEEAQRLVEAIARSVENPVDGPLCRDL